MGNSRVPYIILNIIRSLNILSIVACIVASACLLVKTADLTKAIGWYNVFDLAEKCLIINFGICLLITELPRLLRGYIMRNWPSFGHDAGFWALSVSLLFLGCDVLSYLAKEDTDEKHLGSDYFRMVQAAGFMTLVMVVVNIVATISLKDRRRGLTARQVRGFRNEFVDVV